MKNDLGEFGDGFDSPPHDLSDLGWILVIGLSNIGLIPLGFYLGRLIHNF